MDTSLILPFVAATKEVVEMMAATPVTVGECREKRSSQSYGVITGVIGMASERLQGGMVLSFDQGSILEIAGKMLGMEYTELTDDIIDVVGEITNIVNGSARRRFSEQGVVFDMAIPLVIHGQDIELTQLTSGSILSVPFSCAKGQFVVEASLAERRSKSAV